MVHLLVQVDRHGTHYEGSLTRRSDGLRLPFSGVLELLAALDRLTCQERPRPDPGDGRGTEVPDA